MTILAIDPGSEQSAWVMLDGDDRVTGAGIEPNHALLDQLRAGFARGCDVIAIEKVESYGMAVGADVFTTVHWSGRFTEAAHPAHVLQVPRKTVKLALCGNIRAKDPNIRAALIDRFGGPVAIGTKAAPGPLYGIRADLWAALAVAVTVRDESLAA